MKSVSLAKARIQELLDGREAEIASVKVKFEKASASVSAADREAEKAMQQGDIAAFKAATSKKSDAAEEKTMFAQRLDYLTTKPLISAEEYQTLVSAIFEEHREKKAGAKQRLAEMAEKMSAISEEFSALTKEANETLEKLQRDVYRNADRQKLKDGSYMPNTQKRVDGSDVWHWGRIAITSPYYEAAKRKD